MRLINTSTLEFKEFFDPNVAYVIVSHRWGDDEMTYQQYVQQLDRISTTRLNGWQTSQMQHLLERIRKARILSKQSWGRTKIIQGCRLAKEAGVSWLWIDTVCINKDSSAELSEAINSMYKWYNMASECYVFLPDVRSVLPGDQDRLESHDVRTNFIRDGCDFETPGTVPFYKEDFISSDWHTRGWTLQELLAPHNVQFFNRNFERIGSKKDLVELVYLATEIPKKYILKGLRYGDPDIAERMRFASKRKTSREEDMAYRLKGIFDVNMPLLYGEGDEKAFVRLQRELIQKTGDESLFAWVGHNGDGWWGLLAPSPYSFQNVSSISGETAKSVFRTAPLFRRPHAMTSQGLRLDVDLEYDEGFDELISGLQSKPTHYFELVLPLNCCLRDHMQSSQSEERLALWVMARPVMGRGFVALRAYRRKLISYHEETEGPPRSVKVDGSMCRAYVADFEGPTKRWELYFAQKAP